MVNRVDAAERTRMAKESVGVVGGGHYIDPNAPAEGRDHHFVEGRHDA